MSSRSLAIFFVVAGCALLGFGCRSVSVVQPTPALPAPVVSSTEPSASTTSILRATTSTSSAPHPRSSSPLAVNPNTPLVFPGILPAAEVHKHIRLKTTKGDIVIGMNVEAGPRAASNFVTLVRRGFYNGLIFHRVIPGFMIQGGDPDGTGMGGPGYKFGDDPVPPLPTKTVEVQGQRITAPVYEDGIVAMANAGPNTNGSQFFILVADYPLPPNYSIFGKVISGLDVAHAIANVSRDGNDRPQKPVKMESVSIEE